MCHTALTQPEEPRPRRLWNAHETVIVVAPEIAWQWEYKRNNLVTRNIGDFKQRNDVLNMADRNELGRSCSPKTSFTNSGAEQE
jgi:hypothetical protein